MISDECIDSRLSGRPIRRLGTSRGGTEKIEWECLANPEHPKWFAKPSAVAREGAKGTGCPACAPHGFDPSKPSLFYLVRLPLTLREDGPAINDHRDVLKIGIMNTHTTRLKEHQKNGWEHVWDTRELGYDLSGERTRRLESDAVRWLQTLGSSIGNRATPGGVGAREAFFESETITPNAIIEWVCDGLDRHPSQSLTTALPSEALRSEDRISETRTGATTRHD
jgi:hypothetical protein